ncbi:scaffold attachment factor B2-like [Ruditapes philippinarum]|uniref:scaffold attachment factor B2-like n=1 Tax=Ruditapes philippinarum TaxID=129788 RepID=UPI00295BEC03|nr:scaffold attachment factor B2-like [Ruditapes philippinarum]
MVLQVNKAKRDFLAERQAESEAIMTADKSISEKEQKDELEKREKKLEADFKEAQEKALKHSQEELERQRKQHDEQMAIIRKEQKDCEEANKAAFLEERLARRDQERIQLLETAVSIAQALAQII